MHRLLLLGVVIPWLLQPGKAQQSDGPFLGAPLYLLAGPNTLGPGGTTLPTQDLYYKRAGFHDLASASAPTGTPRPDFRFDMLFPGRPPAFRVNAVSSDNCTVFARWDGSDFVLDAATMPAGTWGALLFSVSRQSSGGSSAIVAAEALRPDGAGADLFSVVLPYSTLPSALSCVPIGVAQRASNSPEMGFRTGAQRPEMLDFDPFFTFYHAAAPIPSFLVPDPWLYFCLPAQALQDPAVQTFTTPWFQRRLGVALAPPHSQRSAATILRTQWNPTLGQWSPPEVFLSYAELGLLQADDIDALSVDGGSRLVLVSLSRSTPTARTDLTHQLMVASYGLSPLTVTRPLTPWVYDDGTDSKEPVGKIAGADGGGEIDASCPVDPSSGNGVASRGFGYIQACRNDLPFAVTMGASAMATESSTPGMRAYAINLSGAPLGGFAGVVIGFPGPGGAPTAGGPSVLFLGVPRSLTYDWPFPSTPSAMGFELDFQWAASDGSSVQLARTVRLRL